jgi:hypothetical protein
MLECLQELRGVLNMTGIAVVPMSRVVGDLAKARLGPPSSNGI